MMKKIEIIVFAIGVVMMLTGMPYLLGYSTIEFLKYPLYFGLILMFIPIQTNISNRK